MIQRRATQQPLMASTNAHHGGTHRVDSGHSPDSLPRLRGLITTAIVVFSLVTVTLAVSTGSWAQSAIISAGLTTVSFAAYSFRFAWICFTASLTMSGLSYQLFGQGVLPEQVLLLILIFHAVKSRRLHRGLTIASRLVWRPQLCVAAILVTAWLLVIASFSAFSAPAPDQSLRLVVWVVINVVAVFAVRRIAENPMQLVKDSLTTTNVMLVVFILGWIIANMGSSVNIFVEADYASSTYRLKGLMLEPNLLAALALTWLCVGYVFRTSIGNRIYWSSISIMSFGIFMTYTRAAWVILLALVACALWTTMRRHRGLLISALMASLPIVGLLVFNDVEGSTGSIGDTIQARFSSLFDFQSGTGAYRTRTWEIALQDILRDGWWTGHGYNSFSQSHFSSETSNGTLYLGLLWLSLIYDGGLLSFLLFVTSMILLWKSSSKDSSWFYIALIILSTSTNPTWFMFPWVMAALLITPREPQLRSAPLMTGRSKSKRATEAR